MFKVWVGYCIEETEHKAVAYDVYQHVYGTDNGSMYVLRSAIIFYDSQGLFVKAIPHFLDYFRPSFHPNDHDAVAMLKTKLSFSDY
jgi:predicted metal-dependent hydrolase